MSTQASTATTTGAQSYWDTVPASQRRNLAEQLLIHCRSHYPACTGTGFGAASSIKHPDCFWCCVGAHLDCDYDFLQKLRKQKLDEIASFAKDFFFHRDCSYLPNNHSSKTQNTGGGDDGGGGEDANWHGWRPKG